MNKNFLTINFGCRVNAAETNQISQSFIDKGYIPSDINPQVILINTCAVTKKGEYESIYKIKEMSKKYPKAKIIATGCANLNKISNLPNIEILNNIQKDKLNSSYSPKIKDKYSRANRYLLKIQSGCTQFCSYCIVPFKRKTLWSLSINKAISTVNQAIKNSYTEVIITGVNIDQYQYGFSNLLEMLLKHTPIPLISFGSIPINSINTKFISLLKQYPNRLSHYLHIPIQSGSDKILKLMSRPYNSRKIISTFNQLKTTPSLTFGTDIIVGFPGETELDFQNTLKVCQKIKFSKIHTFRFSSRPDTNAKILHQNSPKFTKNILKQRSFQLRQLISQTTLPSHQTPET